MSQSRGLCLIAIPKSGTMFLSRYLERVTGRPVVFGLDQQSAHQLARELDSGWHPAIRAAADPGSLRTNIMCQRFAQMLARHRQSKETDDQPRILSDHGYHSFLQFLINPSLGQIRDPASIIGSASERQLATVFLHRSLSDVANSLALFLASRKSFLLSLNSAREAAALVAELRAPVIAAQTSLWLKVAAQQRLTVVSYAALVAEPARWIRELAQLGNLPVDQQRLHDDANAYRSWTYRRQTGMSATTWRQTFTSEQQAVLGSLAATEKVTA